MIFEVCPVRRARNPRGYLAKGWRVTLKQGGAVAGVLDFPTREQARAFRTVLSRWLGLWS